MIMTIFKIRPNGIPANTIFYNICTTPAQRHRRWSNIVQMLYKCFALLEFSCLKVQFILTLLTRDPQLQVREKYSDLTKWKLTVFKYC